MEDVIGARSAPSRWPWWGWAAAAIGWAGVIFWFSSHTGSQLPKSWLLSHDKLCHGAEYALLGFLICAALGTAGLRAPVAVAAAALLAALYGVSDEYHQGFVAGRQGNDPFDMAADAVGGTLGAAAFAIGRLRPPAAATPPSQESPA